MKVYTGECLTVRISQDPRGIHDCYTFLNEDRVGFGVTMSSTWTAAADNLKIGGMHTFRLFGKCAGGPMEKNTRLDYPAKMDGPSCAD